MANEYPTRLPANPGLAQAGEHRSTRPGRPVRSDAQMNQVGAVLPRVAERTPGEACSEVMTGVTIQAIGWLVSARGAAEVAHNAACPVPHVTKPMVNRSRHLSAAQRRNY